MSRTVSATREDSEQKLRRQRRYSTLTESANAALPSDPNPGHCHPAADSELAYGSLLSIALSFCSSLVAAVRQFESYRTSPIVPELPAAVPGAALICGPASNKGCRGRRPRRSAKRVALRRAAGGGDASRQPDHPQCRDPPRAGPLSVLSAQTN
eukprot:223922-Hanusia_phi.AAC.2